MTFTLAIRFYCVYLYKRTFGLLAYLKLFDLYSRIIPDIIIIINAASQSNTV